MEMEEKEEGCLDVKNQKRKLIMKSYTAKDNLPQHHENNKNISKNLQNHQNQDPNQNRPPNPNHHQPIFHHHKNKNFLKSQTYCGK